VLDCVNLSTKQWLYRQICSQNCEAVISQNCEAFISQNLRGRLLDVAVVSLVGRRLSREVNINADTVKRSLRGNGLNDGTDKTLL
jgi:hypothetical protein